jgi:hypothetical protein
LLSSGLKRRQYAGDYSAVGPYFVALSTAHLTPAQLDRKGCYHANTFRTAAKGSSIMTKIILLFVLLFGFSSVSAQSETPEVTEVPVGMTILSETPPTTCTANGWYYQYAASTPIRPAVTQDLVPTRYVVQWVDGELNLVHYWGSGYNAYVQNYMGYPNSSLEDISGSYVVPLLDDTYEAVTIESVLVGEDIVWETRVEITCEAGVVTESSFTSQAVTGHRADLPVPEGNLVLALEDIPRYSDPYTKQHLVGTITACQTFFISGIYTPRASISTWGTDSITGLPMLLHDYNTPVPLVDVPEDYGQPGGAPIIDACAGA